MRLQLIDGIDPIHANQEAKAKAKAATLRQMTFRECADTTSPSMRQNGATPSTASNGHAYA
jgi:hypothetical protein